MATPPTMNQQIFQSGLSKETISAYLLCCALTDEKRPITTGTLREVWNGSADQLDRSLAELNEAKIVQQIVSDGEGQTGYRLMEPHHWHLPE